ncbi:MAG: peptidase S41, partial [Parvibaculum sp.]
MNKSVFAGFAVGTLLSFAAVVGLKQGVLDTPAYANEANTYQQLNLFGDVFERVRADYVEPTDDAKLVENAINGMLTSLDPHSSYMTPKTFRDMQVQTRGEFGGLGIEVTMENGVVKVVTPIDDTPASR